MIAELRIRTGSLAGHVRSFEPGQVRIGRGADADFRFAVEADLEVSGRHALLTFSDGAWQLHDLASRNGTYVNGVLLSAPVVLQDGDEIRFGPGGPVVEFRVNLPGATGRPASRRATGRWPVVAAGAAGLAVVLLAAGLRLQSSRAQAVFISERQGLLARIDTLIAASESTAASLAEERAGLAGVLRETRDNARAAREQAGSGGLESREDDQELLRRLQSAETALARQQLAATLDVDAVTEHVRYAVTLLYAEDSNGVTRTATGFAVRGDGTIISARHLFEPPGAASVQRVAVQFAYSDQVWPARVIGLADDFDIAVVKVDGIAGGVPNVATLAPAGSAPAAGRPVALVGFPLGGAAGEGNPPGIVRPVFSVGVVMTSGADRLEVQGYGASGASGSPIMDEAGRVVGVLFGGRREQDGQVLVAVPAGRVRELLSRFP